MSFADEMPIGEVAELFRVSTQTIRRWTDAGKLPSRRSLGNQRKYVRSEIEAKHLEVMGETTSEAASR